MRCVHNIIVMRRKGSFLVCLSEFKVKKIDIRYKYYINFLLGGIVMAGLVEKFKEMWSPSEEYEDDYEEESVSRADYGFRSRKDSSNRVVSIHATAKLKVVLVKPEKFGEEVKNIADELLKMHTIVLNLEGVAKPESRRIIDFLSGVAYANGGKIKKVSTDTFVVTPCNVDLEGEDFLGELENHGVYF